MITKFGQNVIGHVYNPSMLFVKNKLSEKPAKAVKEIEKMVKNQNNYHVSMSQDYSNNVVKLNLLSKGILVNPGANKCYEGGHFIYQSSQLPVTSAVKRYKQVVQNLLKV